MVNKKKTKPRSKTYEKPLKIHGSFEQAVNALVKEPEAVYKKEK
jgi:hypothetical protein